ncbi:bifunctional protein-disulfide isomerase/oxidoreductase DsbC [Shewanella sedimentimangrovi]|uniref:Thiol:disulfide interchange protein n=1 Tax=Shewanella sedimentimangrovi TaxID=2814293 RepID=A0ABX7R0I0_9GAMM|nr:bifunctional protein-disulfide isomerase/oxidoreductase DsbC [Shewanella sedimentimangrovi]QSX36380.1 bifunctional protein-disulfide isomerase/oxidoreductase DsbC [Shewanella sedimentimangrovi]
MKMKLALSLIFSLVMVPATLIAAPIAPEQLKQKLTDTLGVDVLSIEPAPVKGLFQVITNRGVLYINEDGSKLFHGNLYDLDKGMDNLTEAALAGPRMEMLKPFEDKMLVYKAKDEKHVVTVFTDITCGYCRKLHKQMAEYNDLGISVRYLAFPRQGVPSENAEQMEAVWCAKDPHQAMDDAKAGKAIKAASCDANIAEQYNLGATFGINGTPALILEDGTLIPGYQPPKDLYNNLERHAKR